MIINDLQYVKVLIPHSLLGYSFITNIEELWKRMKRV